MSTTKRWYVNDIRATTMRSLGWEGPCLDQILILDKPPSEAVADEGRNCVVARISYEGRSAELCDEHLADAHMLAAAPDLYEALAEFRSAHFAWLENSHREDPDDETCKRVVTANKKAEAALARARGETSK
jgi:hypothetical protein